MAKATVENLDNGQLGLMWNFLKMGSGKPNIPVLKEHLDALRQLLIQKTGGEQSCSKAFEIPFEDADTIINCIAIETMQIYLSGGLDKLENSSDVAPVKHGHIVWKEYYKGGIRRKKCLQEVNSIYIEQQMPCKNIAIIDERYLSKDPYCSECGKLLGEFLNYCGNCGAEMDGGDENV